MKTPNDTKKIMKHRLFAPTMALARQVQNGYERMSGRHTQNVRNPITIRNAILDVLPLAHAPKTKEEVAEIIRKKGLLVNSLATVAIELTYLKRLGVVGSFPFIQCQHYGRPSHRYFLQEPRN